MEKDEIDMTTHYNLDVVVKKIETVSGHKAVKDNIFRTEYMIGNLDEDTLFDIGFVFVTMSNRGGFKTPIYRMGNIEAVFVDQILHVYETI